jgi:hypothetical protein
MSIDPTASRQSPDPDADRIGAPESAFDAAVHAAFGDRPGNAASLRELIALLREAPLDRPSNALRAKAEALFAQRADLPHRVAAWLAAAKQVVMDLVRPDLAGSSDVACGNDGGVVVSLAGFRGAAAPVQTFRAPLDPVGAEAWLDLQIDRTANGSRLRGQVTVDADDPPAMVHLLEPGSDALVASEPIDAAGEFLVTAECPTVTLVIELASGGAALVVRDLVLRR